MAALLSFSAMTAAEARERQTSFAPGYARTADMAVQVKRLEIVINQSRVLEFRVPIESALIAQTEIADVVPITNQSIYVVGKGLGTTRLVVTDDTKQVHRIIEIEVTHDLDDLHEKLSANLDASKVKLTSANGGIVVSGEVRDSTDLTKALAIAERYAPNAVTNALGVAAPQQVMLEVRFVEAQRRASRELGLGNSLRSGRVNIDTGGQAALPVEPGRLITTAMLSGSEPFGTMIARVLEGGTNVDMIIRALEDRSLVRRLAEPNLSTLSGNTASFLAGGEFPVPVAADNSQITIEFKKFGVALAFTPVVLANGQINLKISPEVSEIDPTTSVVLNDIRIPGLSVRRADTTVELRDGQSLAIAGLLQHANNKVQSQVPWLGSVPVLGALFRSAQYQREESDLVIIVTPRLTKPKLPGEHLRTPLDKPTSSNDLEFFALGQAEIDNHAKKKGYQQAYGHILTLPKEVAHVSSK
jgi:pilus assembly protein CpaC